MQPQSPTDRLADQRPRDPGRLAVSGKATAQPLSFPVLLLILALATGCSTSNSGGGSGGIPHATSLPAVQTAILRANAQWTAGENELSQSVTDDEFAQMNGTTGLEEGPPTALSAAQAAATLPSRFTWREQGGADWITEVQRQGGFGTCAAFSTIGAFEPLIRIRDQAPTLSVGYSEWHTFVLGGGDISKGASREAMARELIQNGAIERPICPYSQAPDHTETGSATAPRSKLAAFSLVRGQEQIKRSIQVGPVVGGIDVYADFMWYKSGVYTHVTGDRRGGHAAVLFGWDDNQSCWFGKNSWGKGWGEQGFFKIAFNQCNLERYGVVTLTPAAKTSPTNNPPGTPSITSPTANATGTSLNPSLASRAFSDPDSGDTHASSTWEVYDNASLASANLVWSKAGDTTNKTAIVVNTSNGTFANSLAGKTALKNSTTYFARVLHTDSRGASSAFSSVVQFTTTAPTNSPPATPSITSPVANATSVDINPTILSSAYFDPDGDPHLGSRWEIYENASLALSARVWFTQGSVGFKTSIQVTAQNGTFSNSLSGRTALNFSTQYFARVKHYDERGLDSGFSAAVPFTTLSQPNNPPARPSITSPTNGLTNTAVNPTIQASTFSDPDGDTHTSTTWEVYDDGGLASSNLVWSKANDTVNRTSIVINTSNGTFANALSGKTALDGTKTYFGRVRYTDSRGLASTFSTVSQFTTTPNAWARSYGGTGDEEAFAISSTTDGGYIVLGYTDSVGAGGRDLLAIRLRADGTVAWQKAYGGSGDEFPRAVQQTSDGGFIVAATTTSFGAGLADLWILKLNGDGTIAFQKTYGGSSDDAPFSAGIHQTSDGGFVVATHTASFGAGSGDVWVLKLNSDGTIATQKTFGGANQDIGNAIRQTSDGGYIISASTGSFGAGAADAWAIRLNSNFSVAFQKAFGDVATDDIRSVIRETSDGSFIVPANTTPGGPSNFWLVKLSSTGAMQFQFVYDGSGIDTPGSVQIDSDGGFLLSGFTESFGAGLADFWVLKLASDGSIVRQRTYGSTNYDTGRTATLAADGALVVAGQTSSFGAGASDIWITKLNQDGSLPNFGANSSVSATATSVTAVDTNATIADTSVTPANTSATVTNVSLTVSTQSP